MVNAPTIYDPQLIEEAMRTAEVSIEEEDERTEGIVLPFPLPDWSIRDQECDERVEWTELPTSFSLGTLRDARLRVAKPIQIEQLFEDGHVVMDVPELNEFGFGTNVTEAMLDLQATIVELYFALEAEQERLGPDLASVWQILSEKVRRVDATYSA